MKRLVNSARAIRRKLYGVREFTMPESLARRMQALSAEQNASLERALREHYFTYTAYFPDPPEAYLSTNDGAADLQSHVTGRLEDFRHRAIPWIDSLTALKGKRILEVGCGTGSSTVALAEQGAEVVATDIHQGSLDAAQHRLSLFNLTADLMLCNVSEVGRRFPPQSFDIVALFAVLEHMTLDERQSGLAAAWDLVKPGGHVIVIETPNRLWAYDSHTSQDPFFMWLPDDLAIKWASHTTRERFNRVIRDVTLLSRWGRGVSYHDFSLALGIEPSTLPVASCMDLFYRDARHEHKIYANTWWRRYEELIHSLRPDLHRGFFLEYLNLALQKGVQ
jgi:2-polyprenyl-3-methyl-5-hydroxy-6-metoxy-1,4-benzoquinol methylase